MKIQLAKSAGFCFGVKRAIDMALTTASKEKKVCMLGDIVHNEDVVAQIQSAGIKKVFVLKSGKGKTLLIRAHGIDQETYRKALALGYNINDATCPMVKEIHTIAKTMEKKCHTIIIVGDKDHDEVRGIAGQLKGKAIIIENPANIPWKKIRGINKASVVVQSTQNLNNVQEIVSLLKRHIKYLKLFNTVCKTTRIRQQEINRMPLENDVIIIIGSKNSANTKRLYEISKSLNPNSFWINSSAKLKRDWFRKAKTVGITAGASTPDITTKSIIDQIRNYTRTGDNLR